MEKLFPELKKQVFVVICGLLLAFLFTKYSVPMDRVLAIQNSLITVAGILSGFAIAYLSAKIFNIRAERENRQIKIDEYSEKLTDFRKLLFFVMNSRDFWVKHDHIRKFKIKHPKMTYHRLHSDDMDEEAKELWRQDELSITTIDLYLAMCEIYGNPDEEHWALDKAASFDYTIDELKDYYDPCNQIWYYLSGRYAKYGAGRFNDNGIWKLYERRVSELLPRIDNSYRGKDFHREILADIATEFYELYIPKLIKLTKKNTGVPGTLIKTFNSLLGIMCFGVIFPLVIQSMKICCLLNRFLTLTCVWLTVLSIIVFLIDFLAFLEDDVHVIKSKSGER